MKKQSSKSWSAREQQGTVLCNWGGQRAWEPLPSSPCMFSTTKKSALSLPSLEHIEIHFPPACASWVLGLNTCATISFWKSFFCFCNKSGFRAGVVGKPNSGETKHTLPSQRCLHERPVLDNSLQHLRLRCVNFFCSSFLAHWLLSGHLLMEK